MTTLHPGVGPTPHQQSRIDSIMHWYYNDSEQTHILWGYAGTGKTTVIRFLLNQLSIAERYVRVLTYTGKATYVLKDKFKDFKDMPQPQTIHSLIYNVSTSKQKKKIKNPETGEIEEEVTTRIHTKKKSIEKFIEQNGYVQLIIIDEYSMVDQKTYHDLLSFGIKVLFVGDLGQLPPIGGQEKAIIDTPDTQLEEILRQAEDSHIIRLANKARRGEQLQPGIYGNGEVTIMTQEEYIRQPEYMRKTLLGADQIIVGKNATRKMINTQVRKLKGLTGPYPEAGDKLICLKNEKKKAVGRTPLVNGLMGTVTQVLGTNDDTHIVRFDTPEGDSGIVEMDKSVFDFPHKAPDMFGSSESFFDYGDAITCHKSQGSEWDSIIIFAEMLDRDTYKNWLYTAMTRARKHILLLL